ncbi:glycosyltransferase family 2 protein [Pseudomonas sp. TMP25]|uniref:glycosyltransferase family 2 protein n=1 Tax=Pseudomonas sp. TMP25 TaxID=3136561 RepID=UPI003100CDF7
MQKVVSERADNEGGAPLISVVVPAYNYARLLPRALDSVLAQLDSSSELLVVDDGSVDNTAEVLENYAQLHPELRVMHQANAGAAAARNHGIRRARGTYVLLLDADDALCDGALAELRRLVYSQPDAGMVLGAQVSVYPDGKERLRLPTPVPEGSPQELARSYLLEKRISISHCCSLFRRDLLLRCPYPEQLRTGEDIPVFTHLLVSAPVLITPLPLARIYKHADSQRHCRDNEETNALGMVEAVFAVLPAECQRLRQRYTAQRYLSLFRQAQQAGDVVQARCFYSRALHLSPWQALRWSYLRKRLRLSLES